MSHRTRCLQPITPSQPSLGASQGKAGSDTPSSKHRQAGSCWEQRRPCPHRTYGQGALPFGIQLLQQDGHDGNQLLFTLLVGDESAFQLKRAESQVSSSPQD